MTSKPEGRRKPGIKEIADRTGFSPATVSLVLNDKGSFSEETKHAIRQAYAELSHGMAIAEGRRFVRLLIEEFAFALEADPYNSEIIRAIESECRLQGLEVILTFVREQAEFEAWLDNSAGLILLGGGLITDSLVDRLKDYGVPLVLVDNYTHKGDVLSVHADHYGAGFLATEHLIRRGHERIGFISGPAKYKPLVDRYAGYCAALMEHGLPMRPALVAPNLDRRYIKGYEEMKSLMRLPEGERPTAVFAVSDRAAFGALQALEELGSHAGAEMVIEMELVGCDNIRGEQMVSHRIATIDVPRQEIGQMAVRFLVEAIKGNTLTGSVVMPGKLKLPAEQRVST
ncbi:LacI family DNA-binding transcriptional regulator [Paenibacillus koleovorans]|uniref:LacI family DNA-binding transcriptional regulator n=1 Tax=Paenibacillus koleovorans TaxID=121608 RepID=UPI000FDA3B04|nr:LacI family DNA-binding transcriptional regulator [Paenibacillus koleovorans]